MSKVAQFHSAWNGYRQRVESALAGHLENAATSADRLQQAMTYACLNGGKRFRAVLVYACGDVVGVPAEKLDTAACAVEMIHAYSLVHDDLPGMDDDELRRGKPTCHVAFDEATAILVGDALQSFAFEILASPEHNPVSAASRINMIQVLSRAIGGEGMAGGQSLDMEATNTPVSLEQLETIHRLKTGALIRGAAEIGILSAGDPEPGLQQEIVRYAEDLGHAFQVYDDVLDAVSDPATLGKNTGADEKMHKSTYVSLLGLEQATEEFTRLSNRAIETAERLGDNKGFLQNLAWFAVNRTH